MDPIQPRKETEAELESFRQQWRAEVSAKARQAQGRKQLGGPSISQRDRRKSAIAQTKGATVKRQEQHAEPEEIEPKVYHDLPDKEREL